MRDPESPQENWKDLKPKTEITLLSEEAKFLWYIQNSKSERDRHGLHRADGVYTITDLEKIKALPEWKKNVLRELIRKK